MNKVGRPRYSTERHKLVFSVPEHLKSLIHRKALEQQRSKTDFVINAIEYYFEKALGVDVNAPFKENQ